MKLRSYASGNWIEGDGSGTILYHAVNGTPIGEISSKEILPSKLFGLRLAGMLSIYGTSAVQVTLNLNNPLYSLILGIIAIIGIMIGIKQKNNLYLYTAMFFLVANVLGYFIKYGAEHGILEGMLLVTVGIAVLGTSIYFHLKRKQK